MMNIYKNKLICFSNKYYLFSKGPKLFISEDISCSRRKIVALPISSVKRTIGSIRLFSRALRLEPRCGVFVNDHVALVSYHGAIFRVNCGTGEITEEHSFRSEMNNPLCFTKIEGVTGFTDGIYYGEYFLNHEGAEVNIHRRNLDGSWQVVYTFPAGSIYHIHGLVPCPQKDCVYILTGDKDEESGIYEAKNDFSEVKVIVSGKQAYRACVALHIENGLLYTTDTPLEQNYLYQLDFDTKDITAVMPIAGPCIYGQAISEDEMIFSTSVEPDSRITGLKYQFTYKLGLGVKDRVSHVYYVKWVDGKAEAKEIFSGKKDIIPMGAGQFGTIMFPNGVGKIFMTGQALRKYDNKTILIDELGV